MIILASNDGGFFYGLASYNQSNKDKFKDDVEIKIDQSSMVQCFSFKWPYICF